MDPHHNWHDGPSIRKKPCHYGSIVHVYPTTTHGWWRIKSLKLVALKWKRRLPCSKLKLATSPLILALRRNSLTIASMDTFRSRLRTTMAEATYPSDSTLTSSSKSSTTSRNYLTSSFSSFDNGCDETHSANLDCPLLVQIRPILPFEVTKQSLEAFPILAKANFCNKWTSHW